MSVFLFILIGMVVTLCVGNVIKEIVQDHKMHREMESSWQKRAKELEAEMNPPVDEDGHRVEYDAHYARQLEAEQGLPQTVRCEDTNCTRCYWKPRMLNEYDSKDFPPGSELLTKRQEWIKAQLDGLSDDLYDLMYEDFIKEIQPEIDAAHEVLAAKREAKRRKDMEKYYATPYEQIQIYLAEGRTYKPVVGWSAIPKDTASEHTPHKDTALTAMKPINTDFKSMQIYQAGIQALKSGNAYLSELNLEMKEALYRGDMVLYDQRKQEFEETKERIKLIKENLKNDRASYIILP